MGGVGSTLAAAELAYPPTSSTRVPEIAPQDWVELPSSSGGVGAAPDGTSHRAGDDLTGLGHVVASLKIAAIFAGVALLTVPAPLQPSLQMLLTLLMLWLWRMLPAIRATAEVETPRPQPGMLIQGGDGQIVFADQLPGRVETPGQMPVDKWGEPDAGSFFVRGRTYLTDCGKVASQQSFLQLVAIDFFKFTEQNERFGVLSRPAAG